MSRLPVMNSQGQNVGEFELSDEFLVFDRGEQALHDVIVAFQAGLRGGNASTLTKGQVAGSNKKPWAQKGLGRARAGYRRSPIWRGGGVAFGPHPRDYSKRVPRNVTRLAFRRALSEKVAAGAIRIMDDLALTGPKTKAMAAILKSLNVKGAALIVVDKTDRNVMLATRNMPRVAVALAREIHPYQLIRFPALLVTRLGMAVLEQRLKMAAGGV
jgi:large subunit ribosomal protein L4